MKALIERQLYKPSMVMPMLSLMQLMVSLDFNMSQVTLVALARGMRCARHKLSRTGNC
ncbi:hypothetical protein GCM10011396_05080 [Undibacterium terreum]|uniref:Uncharacterized protein n=1 Tax=Undibacterium terreum TaxID=1224302 RepID=A0A916U581_9BURK|nr:hypothetical protein GCM10011396_05080 [Undibacterium terreum]